MNTKRTTLVLAALLWAAAATLAVNEARADIAYTWGYNISGELGDGTTIDRPTPGPVIGLTSGVTAVAAGNISSLAVQNGGVYAWGFDATQTNRSIPAPVAGLTSGVTAVAAGDGHSMALQNGGAYAWGENTFGQLGDGTFDSDGVTPVAVSGLTSGVTAVAAGRYYSLAVQNGGVYAWGLGALPSGMSTFNPTPTAVTGLESDVTAIAAGYSSLAVQNGAVFSVFIGFSPVAVPGLTSGVTAVSTGYQHSLALLQNGGVYAWGTNFYGQLGDGTKTEHDTPEQIDPADLHNIIAVAAGQQSSYALSSDGSLWDWGDNSNGELGLGNTFSTQSSYVTPQHLLPPSGFRFTSIDADVFSSYFAIATLATVPEPSTFVLAGIGFLSLLTYIRQRRRRSPSCFYRLKRTVV